MKIMMKEPTSPPLWQCYNYYEVYKTQFTDMECKEIIDLHHSHQLVTSEMSSADGQTLRNCNLFWIPRIECTDWIFNRLWNVITLYNAKYGFELSDQLEPAQLTRYVVGQHYDWHMDLGAGRSSLRKVTAVVELTSPRAISGGGFEVFYGEANSNKVRLDVGDIVVLPSFVMHRASIVSSGTRWSLVFWLNGVSPLR